MGGGEKGGAQSVKRGKEMLVKTQQRVKCKATKLIEYRIYINSYVCAFLNDKGNGSSGNLSTDSA